MMSLRKSLKRCCQRSLPVSESKQDNPSCRFGPSPKEPIIYARPSATAAVEAPGKFAVQSGWAGSIFSGRPVSREDPFCSGPRQFSHPETVAAEVWEDRKTEAIQ